MAKKVLNKKCNVDTKGHAVVTSSRRIVGKLNDTYLTVGEIIRCLQARAYVEEVLIDGTTLPLNLTNYDSDNNANLRGTQKEVKVVPPIVEPKKEVVPVDVVKEVLEAKPDNSEEVINPIDLVQVEEEPVQEPVVEEEPEVIEVEEVIEEEPVVEEETVEEEVEAPAECPQQEEIFEEEQEA